MRDKIGNDNGEKEEKEVVLEEEEEDEEEDEEEEEEEEELAGDIASNVSAKFEIGRGEIPIWEMAAVEISDSSAEPVRSTS